MAFRLPANLAVRRQYAASPGDVEVLEESLPPRSRVLVGLIFSQRYEGFESDCAKAEAAIRKQAGLSTWPEVSRFVTPDADGQPIAWVSYISSPAWWALLLPILVGTFLLPIVTVAPFWIVDKLFPGTTQMITTMIGLMALGGVMLFMPKILKGAT